MLADRRGQAQRNKQFDFEFQAIERERRRVAKELHDEVLPSLARLIRSIESQNNQCRDDALIHGLHTVVAAFRDALGELHSVDLEEFGLSAALSNICLRHSRIAQRSIVFEESSESCPLNPWQQLCIYRAVQMVLRMFSGSGNDALILRYDATTKNCVVTFRVVDKLVSPREWLSVGTPDFDMFDALCSIALAKARIGMKREGEEFPVDLTIAVIADRDDGIALRQNLLGSNASEGCADEDAELLRKRNAELFANIALEVERKRISQELNELVMPHLDKCNALAEASNNVLLAIAVRDRMQLILASVKACIGETHSHLLDQTGLVPSIMMLVDRFTRASFIETTIAADLSSADVNITSDAKFAIYRATQEALNNVEKHSGATLAGIAIRRDPSALVIEIEDNGKGMEQQSSVQSRGLKITRERAEAIGALVSWEKARTFDTGTLVSISLPYQR